MKRKMRMSIRILHEVKVSEVGNWKVKELRGFWVRIVKKKKKKRTVKFPGGNNSREEN